MRQAPLPLKGVINFVAYIGYTLLLSIIFSFTFPFILKLLGKELYDPADPIFVKIQISILILVFVITVIFRKYFYLSLRRDKDISENKIEETIEEYNEIDKDWLNFDNKVENNEPEKIIKKESEYSFKMDNDEDKDDLKIFVDKEIKR